MVGLIAQLLNNWPNKRLRELYQALQDKAYRRIRISTPTRKPLRSPLLLALGMNKLIADYASGLGTKSLAVKYGVSHPTVRLRLKKADVVIHAPGSNARRIHVVAVTSPGEGPWRQRPVHYATLRDTR